MAQQTRKHIEVRPDTTIPFFASHYIAEDMNFADDNASGGGKSRGILTKGFEESEDRLTRTSITTFASNEARVAYHERDSISAYTAARIAYNTEKGITATSEDF